MSSNSKSSARNRDARSSTEREKLAKLEERLAHEFGDDEERQELQDRVLALRRRLGR